MSAPCSPSNLSSVTLVGSSSSSDRNELATSISTQFSPRKQLRSPVKEATRQQTETVHKTGTTSKVEITSDKIIERGTSEEGEGNVF